MSSRLFSTNSNRVLFISFAISASSCLMLALIIFLLHLLYSLIRRSQTSPFDLNAQSKLQRFSYKELKLATGSFDEANLIGKGGSGTVFRGALCNGKAIAVKKLDGSTLQVEMEFQSELQILGDLRSQFVVSLLGYCVEKKWRFLVYEFMPNGSLQKLLFKEKSVALDWEQRFQIILDVARGLEFLHLGCVPPVIHGDVKPGNVLLGADYRARISDFGLSRTKVEGECGINLFSQELGISRELLKSRTRDLSGTSAQIAPMNTSLNGVASENNNTEVGSDLLLQVSSSKNNLKTLNVNAGNENENDLKDPNVNGEDCKKFISYAELCGFDQNKELNPSNSFIDDAKVIGKTLAKDGTGDSFRYLKEWISGQIHSNRYSHSDEEKNKRSDQPDLDVCAQLEKSESRNEPSFEELIKRKSTSSKLKAKWKKRFKIPPLRMEGCSLCKGNRTGLQNSWKSAKTRSSISEMWSGELLSRELSSNTSTRGTVCYAAPECNVTEKSDIYSLGVLILVIVSGRRPLHVLSSPMKLKKANLVSWCKLLAQGGNVLELVDARLKDGYHKEQAKLCINLALLCLQKTPELRPSIDHILKILKGEVDLTDMPVELASTSKRFKRSRRIGKLDFE